MNKLKDLYLFIKSNGLDEYKPVVDIDINYLFIKNNKGTKIFYDDEDESFLIKCRIKCIKDDNMITFVNKPFYMDLYAKTKEDVLSILKSRF